MDANDVIVRPVVTEKVSAQKEANKYVFEVARVATKRDVVRAVRELFGVHPMRVHTMVVGGKKKRMRWRAGYRRDWKKAVITLPKGEKIETVEGV